MKPNSITPGDFRSIGSERPSTKIFVDFKNRGKAEVFEHEDPRAQSLTYLENGVSNYIST